MLCDYCDEFPAVNWCADCDHALCQHCSMVGPHGYTYCPDCFVEEVEG